MKALNPSSGNGRGREAGTPTPSGRQRRLRPLETARSGTVQTRTIPRSREVGTVAVVAARTLGCNAGALVWTRRRHPSGCEAARAARTPVQPARRCEVEVHLGGSEHHGSAGEGNTSYIGSDAVVSATGNEPGSWKTQRLTRSPDRAGARQAPAADRMRSRSSGCGGAGKRTAHRTRGWSSDGPVDGRNLLCNVGFGRGCVGRESGSELPAPSGAGSRGAPSGGPRDGTRHMADPDGLRLSGDVGGFRGRTRVRTVTARGQRPR